MRVKERGSERGREGTNKQATERVRRKEREREGSVCVDVYVLMCMFVCVCPAHPDKHIPDKMILIVGFTPLHLSVQ